MADFAMQYVGYPYVYAGEGPYAFDCSGFTMFVAKNVLGMDITHDMFAQIGMGQSVSRNQLQPGDLVFFADGSSPSSIYHMGLYIGDGNMIEAPYTGEFVRVSSINRSSFYGATRV